MADNHATDGCCWRQKSSRYEKRKDMEIGVTHLLRRPLAIKSSTEVCRLPASSSCTVSQERVKEASQVYAS